MQKLTWLFILFSISFSLHAQPAEEARVSKAVESLREAMLKADSVQLSALTAEKLSYGHSSGLIENKQEFIYKLTSGRSRFLTMDISDVTISVSKHVAIVRHTLQGKTMDNGQQGELRLKVMLVFEKTGNKWLLVGRQAIKF